MMTVDIDRYDVVMAVGVVLFCVGLAILHPALILMALGAGLVAWSVGWAMDDNEGK